STRSGSVKLVTTAAFTMVLLVPTGGRSGGRAVAGKRGRGFPEGPPRPESDGHHARAGRVAPRLPREPRRLPRVAGVSAHRSAGERWAPGRGDVWGRGGWRRKAFGVSAWGGCRPRCGRRRRCRCPR